MPFFRSTSLRHVNAALAILRIAVGTIFVAHGAQKLFVWGVSGVTAGFAQMGVPVAEITGPATGVVELLGGIALIAGLFTRVAALGLSVVMLGAMMLVHLPAFFLPQGAEFVIALFAANVALLLAGPGAYSMDGVLEGRTHGGVIEARDLFGRPPRRRVA